jgi:hypothetical protein
MRHKEDNRRSRFARNEQPVHGLPEGDHLSSERIAASIGIDTEKLETCAEMHGVHPEGPGGTFTRTQADHVRALCSIGHTFGP